MSNTKQVPIVVAKGDGIGPEIMDATLNVLLAAGAQLKIHEVEIGEKVYLKGFKAGIEPSTWDIIRQTGVFLKAPITTPQGGGFKSLNVTVRTTLGLYANIRPCIAYAPFVETKHPGMNVVIVRENEEDLYTGIEYQHSPQVFQALKLITRPGCEKIIRYAFEYAQAHNRKKVTCFTKDNILKLTDGLFHKIFEEIAKDYPEIENEHWIVDIGAAKLADNPNSFDVVVMPNLYGDILSDVAAQIAGSVGLAGSANIGTKGAMFEAIHGSAPRRAGQNLANPSGLLLGGIQMLDYIGQGDIAATVQNAWLKTLEDGIHTYDIFKPNTSKEKVGTKEFAEAIIERLGEKPHTLLEVKPSKVIVSTSHTQSQRQVKQELVGVDIFIHSKDSLEDFVEKITNLKTDPLKLKMIANRGAKVWPDGQPETFCVDCWRCRFTNLSHTTIHPKDILALLNALEEKELTFTQVQNLYTFDGEAGFTRSQEEQ